MLKGGIRISFVSTDRKHVSYCLATFRVQEQILKALDDLNVLPCANEALAESEADSKVCSLKNFESVFSNTLW